MDGAIGSVKENLCRLFRSRAAPSISGINRDGETYVFFSMSKFVFTAWTSEKGRM